MAFTPGPNNIMLAASGVNFGFAHTIPHMAGVIIGFAVLLAACGAGLGLIFAAVPSLHLVLKVAGALYMLWLAFKVATAHIGGDSARAPARPFTFLQAAAFQWVNPKGWAMALGAMALFTTGDGNRPLQLGAIALLFGLVCLPNCAVWALFGRAIARFLDDARARRGFNLATAALLVVSVIPTLFLE
jgi:threonine/homoserine/homoserine lactone efflux protein